MTPKRLETIRRTVAALEMAGGLASPKSPALGAAAELLTVVDALREQRRVLREALRDAWQSIGAMIAPPSLPDPAQGWGVEARRRIAAALDATKEDP